MTSDATLVLEAAMQLSEAERGHVAAILMDSIGDGSSREDIEAAWIAEAKRRLAAVRSGQSKPVAFDDVMQRQWAKLERQREKQASTG